MAVRRQKGLIKVEHTRSCNVTMLRSLSYHYDLETDHRCLCVLAKARHWTGDMR